MKKTVFLKSLTIELINLSITNRKKGHLTFITTATTDSNTRLSLYYTIAKFN